MASAPLADQRQAHILALVRTDGAARVADLAAELGVSDMTVRRDIAQLDEAGLLTRVHGGAVAVAPTSQEPGFAAKSSVHPAQKRAIGQAACNEVSAGDTIAIAGGTTTLAFARHLRQAGLPELTVVTNSLPVADALHGTTYTVILTGGERTPSDALVGPVADRMLAAMHVDTLFLGAHGIHPVAGLTSPNLREAATTRALIATTARTVLLADSSKWHGLALATFASWHEIDLWITDATPEDDLITADLAAARVADLAIKRVAADGTAVTTEDPGGAMDDDAPSHASPTHAES